jgi:RsiW-degrading membrane proteinase PrsW (M82 family)
MRTVAFIGFGILTVFIAVMSAPPTDPRMMLLCSWSGIMIFYVMVRTKFHWTSPNYGYCLLFAMAAICSTWPALFTNAFLSRETELWFEASVRLNRFLGFFLGAGMGEEFWKMGAGMIVLLLIGKDIGDARRILGFVTIGATFGVAENLISYSALSPSTLIYRGFSAVPFHATMGMIHGICVNRSLRAGRMYPLFLGYFAAVYIHTLWDTWQIFMPSFPSILVYGPLISSLVVWAMWNWLHTPEIDERLIQTGEVAG